MRLYKRNARAILSALPKGCINKAIFIMNQFLKTEAEALRKWYNGLLLQVLSDADYLHLLKTKKSALSFKQLKNKGMDHQSIILLKQQLLQLLSENVLQYSGAAFESKRRRYKVRLYKLPEVPALLSTWPDSVTPTLLN